MAMLGLSTAACCSTKKASKKQDKANDNIEVEGIDNRIMLMYGVPMPDGSFPTPVPTPEESPEHVRPGVPFPDGNVAVEMTEEQKAEIRERGEAEEQARKEKTAEVTAEK